MAASFPNTPGAVPYRLELFLTRGGELSPMGRRGMPRDAIRKRLNSLTNAPDETTLPGFWAIAGIKDAMKREHLTILLVDDEPNDLFLIKTAFRAAGITDPIRTVSSGNEAIDYLKGSGRFVDRTQFEFPSFILTDLKMPHGDGFSVLEALRSNEDWGVIPTVIVSASADEDDIKRAYLLGAKSYLTKPATQNELVELLKVFHNYWKRVEVPRINAAGEMLATQGHGKIGARFSRRR